MAQTCLLVIVALILTFVLCHGDYIEIISCHGDHINCHHWSIFNIQTNKESMAIPIIMLIYIVKHLSRNWQKPLSLVSYHQKKFNLMWH